MQGPEEEVIDKTGSLPAGKHKRRVKSSSEHRHASGCREGRQFRGGELGPDPRDICRPFLEYHWRPRHTRLGRLPSTSPLSPALLVGTCDWLSVPVDQPLRIAICIQTLSPPCLPRFHLHATPTINSLKHNGNSQEAARKPHFHHSAVHNESLLPLQLGVRSGQPHLPVPFPHLSPIPPRSVPQIRSAAAATHVFYARVYARVTHAASHMASASPAASGGVPPDGSVLDLVLAGVLGNKLGAVVLAPTIAVFLWFLVSYQTSPLKKYPGPFLAGMWLMPPSAWSAWLD